LEAYALIDTMTNTLPQEEDETPRNTLGDVKAEELVDTPSDSLA